MLVRHMIKVFGFAALLFTVDRGAYCVLQAGFSRIESGERGGLVNRACRFPADIYVLGSSRAWRHYDTPYMQEQLGIPVFNAGADGQGLPYMRVVEDLILQRRQPQLLVLNIDPGTLRSTESFDRVRRLAPFIGESPVVKEMLYSYGPLEPFKYVFLTYRFNSKPMYIIRHLIRPQLYPNGFNPLKFTMDSAAAVELEARPQAQPQNQAADPLLVDLLRETVRAAKEKQVAVILVSGPYWRANGEIREADRPLYALISSLALELNVPYYRFTLEDRPLLRDPELWGDSAHLNSKGARIFTALLLEELKGHRLPSPVNF